jgi:hypothetical protein
MRLGPVGNLDAPVCAAMWLLLARAWQEMHTCHIGKAWPLAPVGIQQPDSLPAKQAALAQWQWQQQQQWDHRWQQQQQWRQCWQEGPAQLAGMWAPDVCMRHEVCARL